MKKRQKAEGKRQKFTSAWLVFILFMVLIGSCNSGTKKAEPAVKPDESGVAKFVFSEEMHNFGSLKSGEVVSFTFVFRNEGTKTLVIDRVESGCKCTEIVIPNKSIEPGKEGQIEVIYNSAGEVGRQLQTITVFSNADQPEKQIFIKANITNELIEIYS
ncbi:MAG TPA: hypothetical protein DHV48_12605 [Prolixibacteraceae bacterium]|nr:hypothetical protein [Prolixibacteraceae bacterium]